MKFLMVFTSCEKYATANRATGLWLGEATHFYHHLESKGVHVDFVSPRGGYVPIEPHSLEPGVLNDVDWKYYADESFRAKLGHTLKPSQVNPNDYAGIYYTGGHGVVFDFLDNPKLQEITTKLFERGAIVSAVCHGCIGLLNVRLSNGKFLLDGKRSTAFSNEEEEIVQLTKLVPYLTETQIVKRGGLYEKAKNPWEQYVVVDGKLVTGQNPASAGKVGQQVAKLLGL